MAHAIENNAYRILGLDTTVDQKDIMKRYKEIINRLKIDDHPEYEMDIKLPEKLRNESNVNDALKRLQSQKSNLKEYFFWFQIKDSTDEKALKFMKNDDFASAIQTWRSASKTNNSVSYLYKKNLAILYCLLLVEKDNSDYLKESLSIWHEIINADKFWDAFSKIYSDSNDQILNGELYSDFKKNVAKQVSDIYVELHKYHKNNHYVKDFQDVFGTHGERTEKSLLQPIYQSIYDNLEELQKIKIDENKEVSDKTIKNIENIVELIQKDLNKLEEIGSYKTDSSKVVRDHVAEGIRVLAVTLHNHANEFAESIKLFKIAVKICGTESLSKIMNSELKKIDKNPYIHCWFCNEVVKKEDENHSLHEHWHQVTGTENDFWGNTKRIQYRKFELTIPRCTKCNDVHERREWITGLRIIGSVILGIGAIWLLQFLGDMSWIVGPLLGLATYFILVASDVGKLNKFVDTKPKSYRSEYPVCKELEENGWVRGEEPSTS